ncbi:pheromone A receptor-domain-containing protein [Mycena pura]|uniref:Pheromone A receptor-domain-containing protein n=1 Tax=Mycena pura TaxID=153505 RepID=A0AAD6Y2G4_9AGAR|nr:pheromone A receptor-domain-containing protein [Mycena pura]
MPGALPAIAFVALVLAVVPLLLHWRSGNVPLLSIIAWLAISDLTYGINAVLWDGNIDVKDLVWCDITTKLKVGGDIALPASALALALQVYRITLQKGRLGLPLELGLCIQLFKGTDSIYEDFGCSPAIYISIPSIIILDVPPLVAATSALIFCSLALINFARQRQAFTRMVKGAQNGGLSKSRYIRLMSLTFLLGLWNALVIALTRSSEYRDGLLPWTTWDDVHADFDSFAGAQYPLSFIPRDLLGWLYFGWLSVPISSLFVFGFFAFGREATSGYRACTQWFGTSILRRSDASFGSFEFNTGQSESFGSVKVDRKITTDEGI